MSSKRGQPSGQGKRGNAEAAQGQVRGSASRALPAMLFSSDIAAG